MKHFFLISTDHLEDRLWFRDEEDFRVAMNYVAVAAFLSGVLVIAFVLMSNHVHFVVCASGERTGLFINKFKQLYATYYRRKYGVGELLRRNNVDYREVRDDDESLERAIAYVLMNPVAANICMEPTGYPWGSGNTLFNTNPFPGQALEELSGRTQINAEETRLFPAFLFEGQAQAGERRHALFPGPEYPFSLSGSASLFVPRQSHRGVAGRAERRIAPAVGATFQRRPEPIVPRNRHFIPRGGKDAGQHLS